MKTSQNLPGVLPYAVCRDDGLAPGSAAEQPNLVIEILAEFAAAGVPAQCVCIADCAYAALPTLPTPPTPGHDGPRSSAWILPTAR